MMSQEHNKQLQDALQKQQETIAYYKREINGLKKMVQQDSFIDPLTGLYNRLGIESILNYQKNRSNRSKKPFSILLIDIRGIDEINQQLGMSAGDRILHDFAEKLSQLMRGEDAISRWEEDKFIVLLSDCYYVDAEIVAKKIQFNVKDWEIRLEETLLDYWVNISVSQFNMGDSLRELLERAEYNLKAEKIKTNRFKK